MDGFLHALAGGVLIGLSAVLLLWLNGRVAGISGFAGGVLFPQRGDVALSPQYMHDCRCGEATHQ